MKHFRNHVIPRCRQRPIGERCIVCHAGRMASDGYSDVAISRDTELPMVEVQAITAAIKREKIR